MRVASGNLQFLNYQCFTNKSIPFLFKTRFFSPQCHSLILYCPTQTAHRVRPAMLLIPWLFLQRCQEELQHGAGCEVPGTVLTPVPLPGWAWPQSISPLLFIFISFLEVLQAKLSPVSHCHLQYFSYRGRIRVRCLLTLVEFSLLKIQIHWGPYRESHIAVSGTGRWLYGVFGCGRDLLLDFWRILTFKSTLQRVHLFNFFRLMCAETPSQNNSIYACSVQTVPK